MAKMGRRPKGRPAGLRIARERAGYTLAQVKERYGLSVGHLSEIERGLVRPSEGVCSALDGAYGLEPGTARRMSAAVRAARRGERCSVKS